MLTIDHSSASWDEPVIRARRQNWILSILDKPSAVEIAHPVRVMPELSHATLRREIADLAENKLPIRPRGGAVLTDANALEGATRTAESGRLVRHTADGS